MERAPSPRSSSVTGWSWRHVLSGIGVVVLVVWLPFFAFVSLIGPGWAVFPALAFWGICLWLCLIWFRPHPLRVLGVGIGAVVVWHLVGFSVDVLGWRA